MSRQELVGGAYEARSVASAAQRCVNLIQEPLPEAQGEPAKAAHYPTPGLRLLSAVGPGPIRGVRQSVTGATYCVSGSGVYKLDPTTWAGTHLGDITPGLHTPVSLADNGLDMVIVDGSANGWHVTLVGDVFGQIPNPDGTFYGADRVDFLDTYLLFNKPNTPQFYSSDSLALTFDPLWFANKESYSDLLRTLIVVKRDIWLLGDKTTEVWANVGKPDFPFERQADVFIDHGIVAKYSVANYDNGVFWLTADRQGQGIVMMGAGYQTKRVTTYAIENEIAGYSKISDAIGFCYQIGGHTFYVLTFPSQDKTWVYDITTGLWHEWLWIDSNGDEHRHRANCYWPVDGVPVVGDWQNGNLYALDHRVFTDNGRPIKRVRSFPHVVNNGKRVFYRQFLADMDTGNPSSSAQVVTNIETIITWLPEIARFNGVSVGSAILGVRIDWERGLVYMIGQHGYQKYTTALTTQTPLVTTTSTDAMILWGGDTDPLSGDLILQISNNATNGQTIKKIDPNTFAILGTFGVETSFPSYPTSMWAGEGIACVVCNGVSFGFSKGSAFSGGVSGFRIDTMQHCGFYADIVSGSINNRGLIIAGKSGGTAASVFLSYSNITQGPSAPLYRIDIAASATSYNPATWPTTNPGITWTTVGTVAVASVDPTWTQFVVESIGYDLADGNVLMLAGTTSSADGYRLLKLNALTAAVMWNITTGTATIDLGGSRINGTLWFIRNPGAGAGPTSSYRIDTVAGTMTTQPITGFFASSGALSQQTDSQTSLMFYGGTFTAGTGAALPVDEGTTTFSNGWALQGGQTVRVIVEAGQTWGNLISLSASDDQGHSYGNPVSQSIGAAGEYRTSLQWNRLGMARNRVFKLEWSVPTAAALMGCWIDVTLGQS